MPQPRRRIVPLLAMALSIGSVSASQPVERNGDRLLEEAVVAITRADHRSDRAELQRLAESLAANGPSDRRKWVEYWSGFAWWRRGMNGYNETPNPPDLLADFERGAARERAALALDADFLEARIALFGCLWGERAFAAKLPAERQAALAEEWSAIRSVLEKAERNPRALWMVGGLQSFGKGADPEKAAATYLRGLAAARAESQSGGTRELWFPAWGPPELLMSLAFLHTLGPAREPRVARAYAEGALAAAPDWHYVRDVLIPQIEKLSERPVADEKGSASPAAGTGTAQDFDFLQGTWEIAYSSKMYGDTVGRWTGTKQADGQVLVDEFRLLGPNESTVALGMTYRVFHPVKKRWAIRYVDVVNGSAWHEGEAWREGADIRLDQRTPEGAILRIRYSEIGPASFKWKADRSTDGGATWLAEAIKIDARRAKVR